MYMYYLYMYLGLGVYKIWVLWVSGSSVVVISMMWADIYDLLLSEWNTVVLLSDPSEET